MSEMVDRLDYIILLLERISRDIKPPSKITVTDPTRTVPRSHPKIPKDRPFPTTGFTG